MTGSTTQLKGCSVYCLGWWLKSRPSTYGIWKLQMINLICFRKCFPHVKPAVTVDVRVEEADPIFNETEYVFVRTSYNKASLFHQQHPPPFNLFHMNPILIIVNHPPYWLLLIAVRESWHPNKRRWSILGCKSVHSGADQSAAWWLGPLIISRPLWSREESLRRSGSLMWYMTAMVCDCMCCIMCCYINYLHTIFSRQIKTMW